ncbi:TfoX/Sxy family protein [Pimelobacter sp. 30-1]|uniref:TfoX/Sxy family protein n=1 Tax=Pimelobacter sp. 30-1 TaxID=2004991 RepID=UPI001C040A9B|nr:TfoX/Sxy family protein [Pimelobacter sp. 30-1]MBU2697567.1 RNA methyltransferase [Pimelobacter sp. 30-1]
MAYDERLAARLRDLLVDEPSLAGHEVTEQKMFGGLGFMVGGNMAVAASGQGGIMVRVAPDETEHYVETTAAVPMEMQGRSMRGWLRVDAGDVLEDTALGTWVGIGAAYAASLPPKPKK